jgi:6-pyruvoyltetrahydropterin/6-carboxytetrahydropterin synthase
MTFMELEKTFQFEAAHMLPRLPEGHKCRRLHGHSFQVTLTLRGPLDPEKEWVMDYALVKEAAGPVIDQLDHQYLNEIEGLANPTSENIALWIWDHLHDQLPLTKVHVRETCNSACIYRGPKDTQAHPGSE